MNINQKLYNNYALVCFITKLGDLESLVIHLMIRNHLGLSRLNQMEYSDDVEYLSTIVLNDRIHVKLYMIGIMFIMERILFTICTKIHLIIMVIPK